MPQAALPPKYNKPSPAHQKASLSLLSDTLTRSNSRGTPAYRVHIGQMSRNGHGRKPQHIATNIPVKLPVQLNQPTSPLVTNPDTPHPCPLSPLPFHLLLQLPTLWRLHSLVHLPLLLLHKHTIISTNNLPLSSIAPSQPSQTPVLHSPSGVCTASFICPASPLCFSRIKKVATPSCRRRSSSTQRCASEAVSTTM